MVEPTVVGEHRRGRFELYGPQPGDRPAKCTLLWFDRDGVQVGQLWWRRDDGQVTDVYVVPHVRRRGVGTAMWEVADRCGSVRLQATGDRTADGGRRSVRCQSWCGGAAAS